MPLRVVYLIGAGATQAEINHRGGEKINLLMQDNDILGEGLATRIIARAKKYKQLNKTASVATPTDVEKLISLLDNTAIAKHRTAAEQLRQLYRLEILRGLRKARVLQKPELAIYLLRMHQSPRFTQAKEHLVGIINLNHDSLFQIASQRVFAGLNLGFHFNSHEFNPSPDAPPIVKPHGSFDWSNTRPIQVGSIKMKGTHDILWIPPTILKESKDYPYNQLIGMAHEILATKCDVLRVIGCRLSQNDWNIVSLLFSAQHHQLLRARCCFRIELIMPHKAAEEIKKEYSYLQGLVSIGYLQDGDFSPYLQGVETGELQNPFKYWLRTKIRHHTDKNELQLEGNVPDWLN
jgi:hypothetical protein